MHLNDFKRLIAPLKSKIFLLLGRAILTLVNNSEKTQKISVMALDGETITDMERLQEYGFETYPLTYPGAETEVISVFLNGNRDHGIVICVHNRDHRPQNLVAGEVMVYTDENTTAPMRIHFKRNRIINVKCRELDIEVDDDCNITVGGNMAVNVTGNHETNAARIDHN